MNIKRLTYLSSFILLIAVNSTLIKASGVPDQFSAESGIVTDTIPLKDRTGDFINDSYYNPFDILPSEVKQEVEYDAKTNRYILTEKIGDEYYRPPTYMTFDEYMDWKTKQQEKEYFNNLAGIKSTRPSLSGKIDPMDKIDVSKSLVDRMFGGTEVTIKPQGSVDLTLGLVDYRRTTGNLNISQAQARQLYIPGDFRIQPRLNVDGSIGEKLNLGFNYDANATFDFDRKIKLDYSADAFNEDDIIKKIEAGNVSLPLKGNLIQGGQNLFGFKTELQFGHLRVTGLMSQQRSRQNNLAIENGASVQEFDLTPDQYDENRHFFLSHFNRENYEGSLQKLPQILTPFRLVQMEVWVTNDRTEYQDRSTQIVGISDLGEGDIEKFHHPNPNSSYAPIPMPPAFLEAKSSGLRLPDNRQSRLFSELASNDDANETDKVAQVLSNTYGMQQTRDFESFQGRLLNSSEYTFHPQLGFISVNFRLRPNQSLAVSYKYYYTEQCDSIFTVGQLVAEGVESAEALAPGEVPEPSKVIFAKLLKSTNQQSTFPMFDLMMKNVYNLRTSNLTREGFTFDVLYEDDFDDGSLKKYIPNAGIDNIPLLNIFKLDTLNRFGDPQSDGIMDYIPGVTVIERTGSIVFPVLEPFGSNLRNAIPDKTIAENFVFQSLYDTTLVQAQNNGLAQNKFIMRVKVESATSGEINLGPSIPRGSVRVRAGGVVLVEGQDYEIDYSLGRLRIINPAYLSQATPINVSFEDNGAFNLNTKVMNGLRLDYDVSKKFSVGATYLRLFERPFTQKVNIGNDPINNRIFGLDFNYNDEMPWLTSAVDKLPFYSTTAASSIALTGEAAYLRPGHNKAININSEEGGVVNIDDFEGAVSGFTLGGFDLNAWTFCSTPPEFPESTRSDDLAYGANRARVNWYQVDESARGGNINSNDPYSRRIDLQDLFDRDVDIGQNRLYTFDISYYPKERGIYNFDPGDGGITGVSAGAVINEDKGRIELNAPETRWGGIMRGFQNTDFETANYEFIEFWVMNPFMDREDGEVSLDGEEGEIVFHLGNVSEDIVKDNLQFYENGIPTGEEVATTPIRNTEWGKVSLSVPVTNGFDIANIAEQDLGFDGLTDEEERVKFQDYASTFPSGPVLAELQSDLAGDNYEYYNDQDLVSSEDVLLNRFKRFNNPQGNAPINTLSNGNNNQFVRGNSRPEKEDLNGNRSLDQAESFHEYRVKFRNNGGLVDTANTAYYREKKVVLRSVNGNTVEEEWYRFQIPLNSEHETVGDMSGFRSIQFMRMYMAKFQSAKTFRLADFQLVRNQWRKSISRCDRSDAVNQGSFSVDKIGVQENSTRRPFNYKIPAGIQQERILGTFGNIRQDEKSMVLRFDSLTQSCDVAVRKLARLNLTQYRKMQMFVHAERTNIADQIDSGELVVFLKVGKDLERNYYEYEMPIQISNEDNFDSESEIWLDTNFIDINLEKFIDAKKAKLAGTGQPGPFGSVQIPDPDNEGAFFRVNGVPSLGLIKQVEIGVRNRSKDIGKDISAQVWVNELRCVGLEEKGGIAAQARAQIKMADLGEFNLSANYSSVGFGALDQKLQDRNQEELIQYDAATTLQLGKILPEVLKINLPFYAQYTKSISNPRFDPYQQDLTTDEVLATAEPGERAEIKDRARTTETIKSFNFTNVKVDAGSGKMPWSPKNLSATYSWTETERKDPVIRSEVEKETKLGLDYRYSMKPLYIKPLKFVKSKNLKFLSEFNFNLIPNTFSFNTTLNQFRNTRLFRFPDVPVFQFDDNRFKWDRNYNLDWDIAKSLRFTFRAQTTSLVDELRQRGVATTAEEREWVDINGDNTFTDDQGVTQIYAADDARPYRNENLRQLGRSKFYTHDVGLSYRVPFKNVPILSWITTTADYKAQYGWTGGPRVRFNGGEQEFVGNTIQNSQSRSLNSNFDFTKLYKKSKYLKKIESRRRTNKRKSRSRKDTKTSRKNPKDAVGKKDKKTKKKDREPSSIERMIIRPFLLIRTVKFSYKEDFTTQLPGFEQEASLLGLSSGFKAPGLDFAAGIQPDIRKSNPNNWLYRNESWFVSNSEFNDQLTQTTQQIINAKIKLEPVKDFDIDIEFSKNYSRNHTEVFKSKNGVDSFSQQALYDIGSFEVTHYGLNTLFRSNEELLQVYKQNRELVSQALPNKALAGSHSVNSNFAEGYGPLAYQVNVPAFIAAYTGKNVSEVGLNIQDDISKLSYIPKPNWQLRYDGLSKIPSMKKIFKSFQLKHGYKSTMGVSRFNTSPEFREDTQFTKVSEQSGDYYAEIEIPAISIQEQFNPIIGVSVKTQSDMSINLEWKKTRRLNLNLQSKNLSEELNNEFVFGFGYVLKDFKGFQKKGKKRRKRGKKNDEDDDKKGGKKKKDKVLDFSKGGLVTNEKGRTLTMNLDVSFRDNINIIYRLEEATQGEPNRGNKSFKIEPSLEYQMYKNLALRWFAIYETSQPYNTQSSGFDAFQTGFTVRFNFN